MAYNFDIFLLTGLHLAGIMGHLTPNTFVKKFFLFERAPPNGDRKGQVLRLHVPFGLRFTDRPQTKPRMLKTLGGCCTSHDSNFCRRAWPRWSRKSKCFENRTYLPLARPNLVRPPPRASMSIRVPPRTHRYPTRPRAAKRHLVATKSKFQKHSPRTLVDVEIRSSPSSCNISSRTKKPLGPMGHAPQEVRGFQMNPRWCRHFSLFIALEFNELLLGI